MDLDDKIEAYLLKKLSAEEAAAFAEQIAADPALKKRVQLHRLGLEILDAVEEEGWRAKIKEWEAVSPSEDLLDEKTPSSLPWLKIVMGLLAGLLILFGITKFRGKSPVEEKPIPNTKDSTALLPDTNKASGKILPLKDIVALQQPAPIKGNTATLPDTQKASGKLLPLKDQAAPKQQQPETVALAYADVSQKEYEKTPIFQPHADRSGIGSSSDELHRIELMLDSSHDSSQFSKVLPLLEKITPESVKPVQYIEVQKMLAHTYYKMSRYANAVVALEKLTQLSPADRDDVQWYRLLCRVAEYDQHQGEADALFKDILQNKDHPYRSNARTLEQALRKR